MTTAREDAWHKYRHGNSPLVDSSEMEPFIAGWSARDAEVERLRAAIAKTVKRFDEAKAKYMPRPSDQDEFADELRAILEPTT